MPSLILWQAASFKPSSLSSRILGAMIPGVSTRYIGGSVTILNPVMLLVKQGLAPALAPDLLEEFYDISASLFLRVLMIVLLPILGIPPIMTHAPTVLNLEGH